MRARRTYPTRSRGRPPAAAARAGSSAAACAPIFAAADARISRSALPTTWRAAPVRRGVRSELAPARAGLGGRA
jgi:hypothetical protein